jgi:hypothetical protein
MRRFFLFCSIAVTLTAFAGTAKHPADWTLEERLAKRFNAADIAARKQAYHLAHPGTDDGYVEHLRVGEHVIEDNVDGSRDPELLLPHELFDGVLTGVFTEEPLRSKQREFYRAAIRHFFGDDEKFWSAIGEFAAPLTGLANRSDEHCRAAHMALQKARARFGPALFDEFLYEAIAPSMQHAYTGTSSFDRQGQLRREAAGCQ